MTAITVEAAVRQILGDRGETFQSVFQGDGVTFWIDLPVENIDPLKAFQATVIETGQSPIVLVPADNSGPQDYSIDFDNGVVVLTVPLTEAQSLVVSGFSYREFSPSTMDWYLSTTLAQWNKGRVPALALDPVTNATPPTPLLPPEEEYVFVLAVAIEAEYGLLGEAAQDVDIVTPDGVNIPRGQYFQQVLTFIQLLETEYKRRASLLNVGLERIEMFNLRRVSRTTNRLVPEYVEREYDNRRFPQRVLPAIDTGAGAGRVITYRGEWVSTVAYAVNDVADYKGQRYICTAINNNMRPDLDVAAGDGVNGDDWSISTLNTGWDAF